MRYPRLVSKRMCKTDTEVLLDQEGISVYGEPLPQIQFKGKCNFQDKAVTVWTPDKKVVKTIGQALFDGDIAPELPSITTGTIVVLGETRKVISGTKARNPDGTVNYTKLEIE